MRPFARLNRFFNRLPVHLALVVLVVMWLVPTFGVFITSFRTREAVRTTGWWTVFLPSPPQGKSQYTTYCAACHGANGDAIPKADLSNPKIVDQFSR